MITIQAASVKELKAIFEEMFVSSVPVVDTPKAETPKPPKEKKIAPAVPETPKVEVEIPDPPPKVEAKKPDVPAVDYDTVLARIKRMKVTTHPSIIDLVNQWKTNQKFPSLKEMTPDQLGACSLFLDGLEA